MKIKSLRCPDCDSQIKMEGNKTVLFCQYCGAQYMEYAISSLPKKIKTKIIKNPNYKDIFAP